MNTPSIPSTLTVHPAQAALLANIRSLEAQISLLEEEKAGCQYTIDHYYRLLRLQLGDLLTQIAELQMKLACQRATQTGRRSDAEAAQTYQERWEHTNRVIQEAMKHQPVPLDETAKADLRRLFRQAVILAHPDRYANDPDQAAQATAFMARLNEAYARQDVATVRQLWQDLHQGGLFRHPSEANHDMDTLQQWYERLVDRQASLQVDITRMKAEESYRLMSTQTDLAEHFLALRQRIMTQIQQLRHQLHVR